MQIIDWDKITKDEFLKLDEAEVDGDRKVIVIPTTSSMIYVKDLPWWQGLGMKEI